MAVLARLLTPADFGYIAMATVVTELAALFGNFGFSAVLVQRKVVARLHLDTVFWASIILGATLATTVFGMSYLGGWLFKEPLTGDLLRILSITFIIGSLTVVHDAILTRLMQFRTIFVIQIITIAVRAVVAIIFAFNGFGVWSLVAGSIAGSLTGAVISLLLVAYLPRFRFSVAYIRSIWVTSSSYFGGGVLFYINSNIDLLLVGRHLGATALGFYQNARSLTDEVRSRIAVPIQQVLFPAFSSIQQELERLQNSVLRSGRLLAAIVLPVAFGISAIAPELVPLLYGHQWLPMIPVLQLLAIGAALRGTATIATPIFNSQNKVGLALKYNAIASALIIGGVLIALPHGVETVALAIAVTSVYSLVPLRVGFGLIGLSTYAVIRMLAGPLLAATSMWIAIYAMRELGLYWKPTPSLMLLSYILAGALIYIICLFAISPRLVSDLVAVIHKLKKKG